MRNARAAGLDCKLQRLGVGRQEVARRDRFDVLAREEAQASLRIRIALGQLRELANVFGVE